MTTLNLTEPTVNALEYAVDQTVTNLKRAIDTRTYLDSQLANLSVSAIHQLLGTITSHRPHLRGDTDLPEVCREKVDYMRYGQQMVLLGAATAELFENNKYNNPAHPEFKKSESPSYNPEEEFVREIIDENKNVGDNSVLDTLAKKLASAGNFELILRSVEYVRGISPIS